MNLMLSPNASPAERLAALSKEEREAILAKLTEDETLALLKDWLASGQERIRSLLRRSASRTWKPRPARTSEVAPLRLGLLPWTPKNQTMALACPAIRGKLFPKCELPHTSQPIPEGCCLRVGGSGRSSGECRFTQLDSVPELFYQPQTKGPSLEKCPITKDYAGRKGTKPCQMSIRPQSHSLESGEPRTLKLSNSARW